MATVVYDAPHSPKVTLTKDGNGYAFAAVKA